MRVQLTQCRISGVSPAIRSWSDAADSAAMQALASRCWPAGPHPGGLGWSMATDQFAATLVVVDSPDGELLGWAGLTQPGSLVLQVDPESTDTRDPLTEWLTYTAEGPDLTIDAFDVATAEALTRVGFRPVQPPFGYYRMGQAGLQASVGRLVSDPPAGYTIRHVQPGEDNARVAVHRSAWRPADLPFHPDHRPDFDESWTSSFTAESYDRVQATKLYDTDLDLVAVAPDGSLAGCCIAWLDPATGWAEIEPLGVVPDHRRQGLALALCTEVARRVSDRGGTHVFINTGPSETYPAPYEAYVKAGFTPFVRSTTLNRRPATTPHTDQS